MLVLGIETATRQVGVALGSEEGVIANFHLGARRLHAETLTPAIDFVLHRAGVELRNLEGIAVDVGPGQFTGLRVGVASAKALSFALGVPMLAISSLHALAHAVRYSDRSIVSILDARRGQVAYAKYESIQGKATRLSKPALARPEELAAILDPAEELLLVGAGAHQHRAAFAGLTKALICDQGLSAPTADAVVEIAQSESSLGNFIDETQIQPFYLRPPDVGPGKS